MTGRKTQENLDDADAQAKAEAAAAHEALQQEMPVISEQQAAAVQRDLLARRVDLATVAGFEPEELEALYGRALEYLRIGLVDRATSVFLALISLKSREVRYFRGLGLCYHYQRLWGWASAVYLLALTCDADDGISMALNAECALHLYGKQQAHLMLMNVVARGVRRPAEEPYIQRTQAILTKIKL